MVQEIRIGSQIPEHRSRELLREINHLLNIKSVTDIRLVKVFRLQGPDLPVVQQIAQDVVTESFQQTYTVNLPLVIDSAKSVEIAYKPGVMNPEVASLVKVAQQLNIQIDAADTSIEYHFYGDLTDYDLKKITKRLLMNETVEQVITFKPATLTKQINYEIQTHTINLASLSESQLLALSKQMQLSLNIQEMETIKQYFINENRDPSDVELETIAQTWSEHCYHKTFKAPLIVDGVTKPALFSRLKNTAKQYQDNVVSAFEDNAGAFLFYDDHAILAKVETHNSPSAIEPYGGAATGSGGVFRDIMGTGKGAKVIASTDMFCFAPPDIAQEAIPLGCLHPHYLLRRVVAGVRDYGNRMGIPTNNGSVHFHEDFKAKPSVIVGAYGITPIAYAKKGVPQTGDLVIVIGGKTGRDGIHGATFSSLAMTDQTITINASAVQIGNAIEQKRVADAILQCRDANLIHAITDCGAGGLSSAIGEMGSELGVSVELAHVPLKYAGLAPWEIWISESQERMVCAIASASLQQFTEICDNFNVPVAVIGTFTGDGRLHVKYQNKLVCDLQMQFLHHGIPQLTLVAKRPAKQNTNATNNNGKDTELGEKVFAVLSDWNICSKEPIVRQYDHTVQGTNALPPFAGIDQSGPNDAAILTPLLGKPYGLIIAHGMNPVLNRIDPYHGSMWAIVEALSNIVAVGGDISDAALVDNFIWPYPDAEHIWMLDAAMQACIDAMNIFKIPFISGKDSLSSTYKYPDGSLLQIPPVLCISAVSKIPDVYKTISAQFKKPNSFILLIGDLDANNFAGSLVAQKFSMPVSDLPNVRVNDLQKRFSFIHEQIENGTIISCHDVSEGGMIVTLAEMCFGSSYGATIDLSAFQNTPECVLFSETAGCFLAEVEEVNVQNIIASNVSAKIIGRTTSERIITVLQNNKNHFHQPVEGLQERWQAPMKGIFQR